MHQIKILNTPSSINPFLIVYKPPFLPCAPLDFSDSENALSFAVKLFPEIKKVCGIKPCEFGLVHRLDTLTEGIFLIALNQEFYDFIQIQQKEGKFIKTYNAECDYLRENTIALSGFPKEKIELSNQIFISSFFRHYGKDLKEVRPVTETSGKFSLKKVGSKKKYTTEVKVLSKKADSFSVQCRITQGFRHQVRSHLAWACIPVKNDCLYNFSAKNKELKDNLKFKAVSLEFFNPFSNQNVSFFYDE